MLTARQLLIKQTAEAFRGRPDMPLMAALDGITQLEASWQPDPNIPSIEQIVRHIAWAKSTFCHQGFKTPMVLIDPTVNDNGDSATVPDQFPCGAAWGCTASPGIAGAIELLEQSHRILTQCLEGCTDESLEQPIPTHHGKTAANFFWVMIMHDLYHAGQIRTRHSMYQITHRLA
jgi:uncharacterized damage-inducible protein DinB